MVNPFEGINQGLQNFIQTQLSIANLKRQRSLDELNMQYLRAKIASLEEEVKARSEARELERQKKESLGEAASGLMKPIQTFEGLSSEEKAYDLYTAERPKPFNVMQVIDKAKRSALERGNFPLYAELEATQRKMSLEEINYQRALSEGVKSALDAANHAAKINEGLAIRIVQQVGSNFGMDIPAENIKITGGRIEQIMLPTGHSVVVTPDGKFHITQPEKLTVEQALVGQGRIGEAMRYMIDKAAAGASVRERGDSIRQDIKNRIRVLEGELKHLYNKINDIHEVKGIFGTNLYRIKGKETFRLSDKEAEEYRKNLQLIAEKEAELRSIVGLDKSGSTAQRVKRDEDLESRSAQIEDYITKNRDKKVGGYIVGKKYSLKDGREAIWAGKYGFVEEVKR